MKPLYSLNGRTQPVCRFCGVAHEGAWEGASFYGIVDALDRGA